MAERHFLMLSAIGPDRPGLVAELSAFIVERGGNVENSRATVMGGVFGVMLVVSATAEQVDRLARDIDGVAERTGMRAITMPIGDPRPGHGRQAGVARYEITAESLDQEGIIHAIADIVRIHGANIVDLETSTSSAPMSGEALFGLRMLVALGTHDDSVPRLRAALEGMARTENLDLDMREATERTDTGAHVSRG